MENQSSYSYPSTIILRLRLANFSMLATLVVPPSIGSCRAMSAPSFVETRSGSIASAPSAMASR